MDKQEAEEHMRTQEQIEAENNILQSIREAKYGKDKGVMERCGKSIEIIKRSYGVLGVSMESVKRYEQELAVVNNKRIEEHMRTQEQIEAQLRNECIMLLAIKKRGEATEKIVDHIKKNNHIYTTRDDEKPEMWIYNSGIYVSNGHTFIKETVRYVLGEAFTTHICNDIINKIEADTYIDGEKFFKMNNKEEIPVMNGILNIFTKELIPFTPYKIFFNKCPVYYEPSCDCSAIEKFLDDVLPNPEDKDVFYEVGGYCLYKEYSFEKAFMFVGGGRNGKGKCIELIKRTIGAENCYALPLSALSHSNADVSQLFGKMVNMAGDIGFADLKDTSMFKALTGRDIVTTKRKWLKAISFENYAKFIFACNELPRVYDLSKGFWDRWVLVEFPHYFATQEEFDKASENERKNWRIRQEGIINRIATPEQLSGLLNKFIEGLHRLMSNKKFSSTRSTEEVKNLWIRKSDSFQAFCMDYIEEDYTSVISKKEIRLRFSKYCKEHKIKSASDKGIKICLETNYGVSEARKQSQLYGDIEFVWEGIKWRV